MPPIIEVKQLSKRFGDIHAVKDLSFTVNQGDVYGFLGQNGAGKSTTIRMLLTLIRPTSGEIFIQGKNIDAHRNEILQNTGAVIERPDLYSYLTAAENLKVFARLSGIRPFRKLMMEKLEQVGLAERADSKVRTFSQGMKQRLGIAVALVHDPSLIILDEPTNGLDPQGIADMRKLIISLSRDFGKTLLVSSHLLGEMEQIATRMIIIDRGSKVVEGEMKDLLDPEHVVLEIITTDNNACSVWLGSSAWASSVQPGNNGISVLKIHRNEIPVLARELVLAGVNILSIKPKNTLEEYFLSLTNPLNNVEPH
jgi:ABC-type multidrug transport system ATPase subunit